MKYRFFTLLLTSTLLFSSTTNSVLAESGAFDTGYSDDLQETSVIASLSNDPNSSSKEYTDPLPLIKDVSISGPIYKGETLPGMEIAAPPARSSKSGAASGSSSSSDKVPKVKNGVIYQREMESYPSTPADGHRKSNASYPSTYTTKTTSVKNQGVNGLCWDYTTLAVLESHLLKLGYPEYDFSEVHMSYAMSNHGGNPYGENRAPTEGGGCLISSAYLMRGMPGGLCMGGAVYETYDPMTTEYIQYGLPSRSWSITASNKPKQVMPKNIYYLQGLKESQYDSNLIIKVKDAVMTYGSVGGAYEYGEEGNNCYNPSTGAFYRSIYNKGAATDHLVQIVGWDDNYSRSNFTPGNQPPGNGAWKVKNSWGTNWGKNGFGWISYYDAWYPCLPFTIDGVTGYDSSILDTYEYDYTAADTNTVPCSGLYMRYYQARSDEVVQQIMVCVESADQLVEVDILQDTNTIGSYTFQTRGKVKTHYPGWYTITLDYPQIVHKGKWFGAVVRTASSIAIDKANQVNSGFNLGGGWNYTNYGFCIKAKTTKDADAVNIFKAYEYLMSGNNLWNLIKGSNTSYLPSVIKSNLSSPGNGPYGTKFQYVISDTRYFHTDGSVTIPPCNSSGQVNVPFTLKLTRGDWYYNMPCQIQIATKPHNFSAWGVRTPATELNPGVRARSCTSCGTAQTEPIAQLSPSLPNIAIKAITPSKKAGTVKWKKLSKANRKKVQYIEIQYSRDSKFNSGVKSIYVSSKKTSRKISGLSSRKKYYVRIRAYTKSGGAVHISHWSATKAFKAK